MTALYLITVIAVASLIDHWGDVAWPATALMFAPRWIWAAPLAVLVPLCLRRDRRAILVPLAAAGMIVLGPILDLRIPLRHLRGGPHDLRIMTYNIGAGVQPGPLLDLIRQIDPDIVAVQERDGPVRISWDNQRCDPGLCLGSRFPIRSHTARDRAEALKNNGSGNIIRYQIDHPRGPIQLTNVHLATPRDGLNAVLRRAWRGAPALEAITRERAAEAAAARAWADEGDGRRLVVGDFNTPIESALYRRTWGDLTNAFSQGGFGFGSTKRTRWHGVRIDHILLGRGFEVVRAFVGPGAGGDHRPMIADVRFTPL